MERKDSLPYSQEPAIRPHPESMNPVHSLQFYSFNIQFNIIFQSNPRNSNSPFRFSDYLY
jgi:hypothetical protein